MRHNQEIYDDNYSDEPETVSVKPNGYDTSKPEFYNEKGSSTPKEKEQTNKRLNNRRLIEKLFVHR